MANKNTVSVGVFTTEGQAEIVRAILQSYEIDAALIADTGQLFGGFSVFGTYNVMVRQDDAARAQEIVDAYFEGRLSDDELSPDETE